MKSKTPLHRPSLLALLAVPAFLGCDDGPTDPVVEDVAGSYAAAVFVGTEGGKTLDLLGRGASIEIDLHADGTTAGTISLPGGDRDGSHINADLTGTWALNGADVTLDPLDDTFLRDVELTYRNGRLVTDDGYVRVVLAPTA